MGLTSSRVSTVKETKSKEGEERFRGSGLGFPGFRVDGEGQRRQSTGKRGNRVKQQQQGLGVSGFLG